MKPTNTDMSVEKPNTEILELIMDQIAMIESEEDFQILLAIESGSRAWG